MYICKLPKQKFTSKTWVIKRGEGITALVGILKDSMNVFVIEYHLDKNNFTRNQAIQFCQKAGGKII